MPDSHKLILLLSDGLRHDTAVADISAFWRELVQALHDSPN
jgi:hypothetical protein